MHSVAIGGIKKYRATPKIAHTIMVINSEPKGDVFKITIRMLIQAIQKKSV